MKIVMFFAILIVLGMFALLVYVLNLAYKKRDDQE